MQDVAHSELMRADPAPGPALGESRARVLAALREVDAAVGVVSVAERVGLHPNTARFHLDALVEAGLADRTTEGREQPGRPRTLYAAGPDSTRTGRRSYRLLAEILASSVAAQIARPDQAAREAGEEWGRYLTERPAPFQHGDAAASIRHLVRTLDDIGFAPEAAAAHGEQQILLHHCPFREVAEEHRDVVCSVHLGLMQGLLTELDAPLKVHRLDPFVGPSLCIAHLTGREGAGSPTRHRAS